MRVLLVGDDGVLESLAFRFMTQGIDFETSASVTRSAMAAAYASHPFDAVVAVCGASGMSEPEIAELMRLFLPDASVYFVDPLSGTRKKEAVRSVEQIRSSLAAAGGRRLSAEEVVRVLAANVKAAA